jgi:hypothetical protein
VQTLIILEFLLSLTAKSKSEDADLTNKSVLYAHTLKGEDVRLNASRFYKSKLRESRPNGQHKPREQSKSISRRLPARPALKEGITIGWWILSYPAIEIG